MEMLEDEAEIVIRQEDPSEPESEEVIAAA
jgi:hypothetical protein